MTDRQPRTREQRRADTLAKLSAPAADAWVATAAADAGGYLVPLSLAWIDERVVLATEADSVTARNIISQGRARLGLGPTRDVVMIDAELEQVYDLNEVPADLATDVVFHLTQGVGLLRRAHGDGDAPVIAVCHGTTLARGRPQ